ncbi:peroxisomal biogenesis factor 11 [Fusarium pseudocircinatum]|uniref:Peroxisomal biogenesis factor 11 n=1 Tax=Fusarium pseudocircinatum TaxID=56676 RepID=A0A8H5PDU4_9HYPO|nr:peroxisomal biogenesis factor 11 [Fusarium pseudocircinatum]
MIKNVTTIASNFSHMRFTTTERDILLKLLIFSSRTTAWLLGRNHAPIASIQRWQLLMKQLALTAKILRTGRFIQQFNRAAGSLTREKHQDCFLAYVTVIRQLLIAVYLTFDNVTIANSIGFIPWKGARRLEIRAFRIWFAAGVCGIIAQIYSLCQLNLPNQGPEKQLILILGFWAASFQKRDLGDISVLGLDREVMAPKLIADLGALFDSAG